MGLRVSPYPNCWQGTPFSLRHSLKPAGAIPSSSLRNLSDSNGALPYCLFYGSVFRGSRNLRMERVKRACSARFDEFEDDWLDLLKELAKKYDLNIPSDDDDDDDDKVFKKISYPISENTQQRQVKSSSERGSLDQFRTLKPDTLEPSELGIQPKPPKWPERDELLRLNFERKINSVGIPLSLRIVQKKLKWQKGIKEASEYTFCSVKKSFSSMVFIIQELQNYALQIRESLYCEDLKGVMAKLRKDMDASFVWLFEQVFWKTPSLMVYVMVLLANFSVFSMDKNTIIEVTPSSMITEVLSLTENKNKQHSEDELSEEKMIKFQSSVPPELEGDKKEEYTRTQLHYKKALYHDPYNGLLLSNYAQFLYHVLRDLDKAEEYFRLSVLGEPPDAEAFSRYADFLWRERNNIVAAEVRYEQAVNADPFNTHHASKLAIFLWSTGAEDTSYMLS